jgi:hypothetical protein
MNLVTVFNTFDSTDADLVSSRLSAAGFNPTILHGSAAANIVGLTLGPSGIAVQVPEDEVDEAREFLAAPSEEPEA